MTVRARPSAETREIARLREALEEKTAECKRLGRDLFEAESRADFAENLVGVLEGVVAAKTKIERA